MKATTIFGLGAVVMILCYRRASLSKGFAALAGTLTVAIIGGILFSVALTALGTIQNHPRTAEVSKATKGSESAPAAKTTSTQVAAPTAKPAKLAKSRVATLQTAATAQSVNTPMSFGDQSPSIGTMSNGASITYDAPSNKTSAKQ